MIEDGSPEALARLGRSPMALKQYWDDLHRIKTELFVSMTDNLYARIFKLPTEAAEDGRERAIVPADFHDKETIVWKANVRRRWCACFVRGGSGVEDLMDVMLGLPWWMHCRLQGALVHTVVQGRPERFQHARSNFASPPFLWQDYPYWYEPGIEHHCIWSSRPLPIEKIEEASLAWEGVGVELMHLKQECKAVY